MEMVKAPMDLRESRPTNLCQIYSLFDLLHSSRGRNPPPPLISIVICKRTQLHCWNSMESRCMPNVGSKYMGQTNSHECLWDRLQRR